MHKHIQELYVFFMGIFFLQCAQEACQIHSAPHPSVWDALHGVCLPAREHRSRGTDLHRARPRILSGTTHNTGTNLSINTEILEIQVCSGCAFLIFNTVPIILFCSEGIRCCPALLFPEWRGKSILYFICRLIIK